MFNRQPAHGNHDSPLKDIIEMTVVERLKPSMHGALRY